MRQLLILPCLVWTAACGSAASLGDKAPSPHAPAAAADATATPQTGDAPSVIVADEASLPACDGLHQGSLAYIQKTQAVATCLGGTWSPVVIQGPAASGTAAAAQPSLGEDALGKAATALYESARKSVFRVTTSCTPKTPYPAGCPANPPNPSVFLGSAFLCAAGTLCTNIHVATCLPATCYDFKSLSVQATVGDTDTLDPGTTQATPFFTTTNSAAFRLHPTYDVAKIPVTGLPPAATILPLASAPAGPTTIRALMPVLSLSFPLGFQDLYTDLGRVDTPLIGECDAQGGVSGYGCPKSLYAFSTSNQTDHGSSGSPLFDVATGKVIGITSAGTDDANADYTWATDAFHITEIP